MFAGFKEKFNNIYILFKKIIALKVSLKTKRHDEIKYKFATWIDLFTGTFVSFYDIVFENEMTKIKKKNQCIAHIQKKIILF